MVPIYRRAAGFLLAGIMASALAACHEARQSSMAVVQPTAPAPQAEKRTKQPKPLNYLPSERFDYAALLPRPTPTKSAMTRAEGDLLLAIRAEASQTALDRAKNDDKINWEKMAAEVVPGFDVAKHPKTRAFMKKVNDDCGTATKASKDDFNRDRPAAQDDRISMLLDMPTSRSYPSGHSTHAMLWARMLSELAPAKKDEFRTVARRVALGRVIAGVHYPTDVISGMALGDAVADALMKSGAFQRDLEEARAEWN